MKLLRENNIDVAFLEDGSIKAVWDVTVEHLEKLRDQVIPLLINATQNKKLHEFTVFTWPPR
jgi:hypothetical protein